MITGISQLIPLNDGLQMPGYGFGCYKAAGKELEDAVDCALGLGYRYIDTASFYENEQGVGEALARSRLPRGEIFVVSKIWPTEFPDPAAALRRSLDKLGLEYLDGYLLHWPGLNTPLRLKAFEFLLEARAHGKIRVAGVSNFLRPHLEELYRHFHVWPAINQIEIHPLFQQKELCAFCAERGIQVVSWSPLGRGRELSIPLIGEMAAALGKSPAQVLLRWQIQKNLVPIPKSVHKERIAENADVFDFSLDDRQMAELNGLDLPGASARIGKDPMSWPPLG